MRFCTILIAIFFLLPLAVAEAQYNGQGYGYSRDQSSYSSSGSTRISGRAIGKLIGAVVAGVIALFGFLYRLANGGATASSGSGTTSKQGPPDFTGPNQPR